MYISSDSYQKRRLQSSYVSVVISIALVLFMMGVLGLVLLEYTKISNYFKEKVVMTLFIKDEIKKQDIKNLQESLLKKTYTKKIYYITKKQAAKAYSKEIGEDFLNFLGTNPLKDGIDLYLKANYITPKKMESLKKEFLKNSAVLEVSYDKPLIKLLTKNIKQISFWLLVISTFFGLIAVILINSSIRLSIYSKRFDIKTMQMVGATKSFIRKPFINRNIRLGFFGAFIALLGLFIVVYYINKYIPSLGLFKDYIAFGYLAVGVICIAFIITCLSTFFATRRFLNLKIEQLYD